ncbi:HAMP domain-containing protein [Schaalia sp. 19OD2882]|nr:HAMP domain-containing protein [Schaalia sp. 19OD2882]
MRRALGAWWVRLGLRRQLVLVISGIFVLAGALLLLAQYMILQNLLVEHITLVRSENPVVVSASPDGPPPGPHGTGEAQSGGALGAGAYSGPASRVLTTGTGGGLETREEWRFWLASTPFSATILARLQLWSALLLAVFVICTILAAHMVTRAVMARIDALARATASITERNLSRRLATDGPEDEVRHLAEGVNVMVARLEDAFARQESFVSNAAHELRTPLTTVRTTLQVAGRQGRIPEDLRPDIDEVLLANRYLEGLVSSLLALSRLGGRSISTHDQVDLAALVDDVRRQEDMCQGVPIRVRGAGGAARLPGPRESALPGARPQALRSRPSGTGAAGEGRAGACGGAPLPHPVGRRGPTPHVGARHGSSPRPAACRRAHRAVGRAHRPGGRRGAVSPGRTGGHRRRGHTRRPDGRRVR